MFAARLERLARDKHSSLLRKSKNYEQNSFMALAQVSGRMNATFKPSFSQVPEEEVDLWNKTSN